MKLGEPSGLQEGSYLALGTTDVWGSETGAECVRAALNQTGHPYQHRLVAPYSCATLRVGICRRQSQRIPFRGVAINLKGAAILQVEVPAWESKDSPGDQNAPEFETVDRIAAHAGVSTSDTGVVGWLCTQVDELCLASGDPVVVMTHLPRTRVIKREVDVRVVRQCRRSWRRLRRNAPAGPCKAGGQCERDELSRCPPFHYLPKLTLPEAGSNEAV